jgi:hypothetical protein
MGICEFSVVLIVLTVNLFLFFVPNLFPLARPQRSTWCFFSTNKILEADAEGRGQHTRDVFYCTDSLDLVIQA